MSLRNPVRTARLLAAGTVLAAGAMAAMPTPAGAADTGAATSDDVTPLVVAPPCVRTSARSDIWHNYIDIKNTCGATYRVKAIIDFGFDSPCVTLAPGQGYTHSFGEWGSLNRVDLC